MLLGHEVESKDTTPPELIALASAVLNRALHDLHYDQGKRAQDVRNDAHRFLTETLWQEGNLWAEILGNRITRANVLVAMKGRRKK